MLDRLDKLALGPLLMITIAPVASNMASIIVTPCAMFILVIMHLCLNSSISEGLVEMEQIKKSLTMPSWFNDCLGKPLVDPTIS